MEGYRAGYANRLSEWGYRPQSAHPWAAEDYARAQEFLSTEVRIKAGVARVQAARDAVVLSFEWQLGSRGLTAISWRLGDLTCGTGKLLDRCRVTPPVLLSLLRVPAGEQSDCAQAGPPW